MKVNLSPVEHDLLLQAELGKYRVDFAHDEFLKTAVALTESVFTPSTSLLSFFQPGGTVEIWRGARVAPALKALLCPYGNAAVKEITDTLKDARLRVDPVVLREPMVRAFYTSPLVNPQHFHLGSLSLLDQRPRKLRDDERQAMRRLVRMVSLYLESRRA